jgi:hypothetical protein
MTTDALQTTEPAVAADTTASGGLAPADARRLARWQAHLQANGVTVPDQTSHVGLRHARNRSR